MVPRPVSLRFSVPEWWSWAVREHELSPATALVLISLCQLGDAEWVCSASERDVAQNARIARSATQRAIARLIEIQAIVDLGRESRREPRKLRVSPSRPPTAAQLRLLATPATRRAVQGSDGGWLVAVD